MKRGKKEDETPADGEGISLFSPEKKKTDNYRQFTAPPAPLLLLLGFCCFFISFSEEPASGYHQSSCWG